MQETLNEALLNEPLLVAFMFILVLSMGIGNILTGFTELIDRRTELGTHWLPFSWLMLLLLIHFGLFWSSLDILLVENWKFVEFIYVNVGPILLFIATGILLPRSHTKDYESPREHYFVVARVFFPLLALCMIWAIGNDFILQEGFESTSVWTIASIPVLLLLAYSRKASVHATGTIVYGLVILSFYVPLGFGAMS